MADQVNPFIRIPSEILSHIYVNTANAAFPLTCKDIYYALNNEHTRFNFCANIFDPTYGWGDEIPDLSKPQTHVVAQNWFTPSFAQRVEQECRARVIGGFQRVVPRTVAGARLPAYCLRLPWTDMKAELLICLAKWNVKSNWSRTRIEHPGLPEAIRRHQDELVQTLIGPAVNAIISTKELIEAVDANTPESILSVLIQVYFTYVNLQEDDISEVIDHVAEKANAAAVMRRYNRLKRVADLEHGGDGSPTSAGCIADWTQYAESFVDGDEFAKAWEELEDEFGAALKASNGDEATHGPGGINAPMGDDDGPCPPGPWNRLVILIERMRRGEDYSDDYESEEDSESEHTDSEGDVEDDGEEDESMGEEPEDDVLARDEDRVVKE